MAELTQARLKELLAYEPETGLFTWRVDRGGTARRGTVAGTLHVSNGAAYRRITIDNQQHYSHRLACLYVTGELPDEVDHKDLDGLNNRWSNLRSADRSKNMGNGKRRSTNKSGLKGVCSHGSGWMAQITINRKRKYLGTFPTPESAHIAYQKAARKLFGEFARIA